MENKFRKLIIEHKVRIGNLVLESGDALFIEAEDEEILGGDEGLSIIRELDLTDEDAIKEAIVRAFSSEDMEISEDDIGTISNDGYGVSYGHTYYQVFLDYSDAERAAEELAKQNLQDDIEMFDAQWLSRYFTVPDARFIAMDEAQMRIDAMSDKDIIERAGKLDVYEELENKISEIEDRIEEEESLGEEDKVYELQSELEELQNEYDNFADECRDDADYNIKEEIENEIEDDPVAYFSELDYTVEQMIDQGLVSIDIDEAAEDSVRDDGVENYLGSENDMVDPQTSTTFYVFGD